MSEIIATLPAEKLDEYEKEIRSAALAHEALEAHTRGATPSSAAAAPFDPFRPVSAVVSDPEDAIGLVRRGVRIAPFARTTPLIPLYEKRGKKVPDTVQMDHEIYHYDFFLVELTFSLGLVDDETPDYAELAIEIHDNMAGPRASRAIEVFPKRVDAKWFDLQGRLSVALDASLQFDVERELPDGKAKADAEAGVSVKALAGPFRFEVSRTELEVRGTGDREIGWIYRVKDALAGKNDFKSFLVLQVARETQKVALEAKVGVRPYRRTWTTLWLREKLPVLYARAVLELELPERAPASPTPG